MPNIIIFQTKSKENQEKRAGLVHANRATICSNVRISKSIADDNNGIILIKSMFNTCLSVVVHASIHTHLWQLSSVHCLMLAMCVRALCLRTYWSKCLSTRLSQFTMNSYMIIIT